MRLLSRYIIMNIQTEPILFLNTDNMQLVIFEGSDGAGKSSLIQNFLDKHPEVAQVALKTHWPKPDVNMPALEYWKTQLTRGFEQIVHQPDIQYWIWDRSFLGNFIYGNYKKDQIALTYDETIELLQLLNAMFDQVDWFLCRATRKELSARLTVTGETYVTPAESHKLRKEYEQFFLQAPKFNKQRFIFLPFRKTVDQLTKIIFNLTKHEQPTH